VGNEYYIGPRSRRPARAYDASRICTTGHFMLIRPAIDSAAPIWLGLAMCNPILVRVDS
jgi:hypothetical protein